MSAEACRLILYDFFQRLRRELGLELDMVQYFDFLRLFISGAAPLDTQDLPAFRASLLALCKIHWLTHPRRYGAAFERLFQEEFDKLIRFRSVMPREAKPSGPPTAPAGPLPESQPSTPPAGKKPEPAKASAPPVPASGKTQESPSPQLTDLFLRFREAAEGLPDTGGRAAQELLDNAFIFSDKHLPVSDRRLQQHWRYLGAYAEARPGAEIDLPATVTAFAERGFLVAPAYRPVKTFRQHTLFLIDDGGSMAAFTSLADHLVETIRESLQSVRTSVYYFHNYPGGQLFERRYRSRPVEPGDFIREAVQDASLLIIISDAGAARGTVHDDRIMQTKDFLTGIRQRVPHVLWLNPMPGERWVNSSAMYLSLFVTMVEASREGLRRLPQILRHF